MANTNLWEMLPDDLKSIIISKLPVKHLVRVLYLWEELPDDLKSMIILKLPVKYLIRLRSICKEWKKEVTETLVKRPCFFLSGFPRDSCEPTMLMFEGSPDLYPDLWSLIHVPDADMGVEGLLFKWDARAQFQSGIEEAHSYVYDVRTGEKHVLPANDDVSKDMPTPALVVNTSRTPYTFQIVGGADHTQLFDSRTGFWTSMNSKREGSIVWAATSAAYCNGSVFTAVWNDKNLFNHLDIRDNLLVYNFESEKWSRVEPPPGVLRDIGSWKDHLYVVTVDLAECKVYQLSDLSTDQRWTDFAQMPNDVRSHLKFDLNPFEDPTDLERPREFHASFCQQFILLYLFDRYSDVMDRFVIFNLETKRWRKLDQVALQMGSSEDDSSGE